MEGYVIFLVKAIFNSLNDYFQSIQETRETRYNLVLSRVLKLAVLIVKISKL